MRTRPLKIAAVVSSLLLVGGYVAYHTTAAGTRRPPVKMMAGSKSRQVVAPATQTTPATRSAELAVMSSSKFSTVVKPSDLQQTPATSSNLTLQFIPVAPAATTQHSTFIIPSPQQRALIAGSKSGIIVTPSDVPPFHLSNASAFAPPALLQEPATRPTTRFSLEP